MRLIDVHRLTLQEFAGAGVPPYAILSHTWQEGQEVTFKDIQDLDFAKGKPGFTKIRFACTQAKLDGLDYAWIDTCCIDKSSSHELSEAINSMYAWYTNARVCYVYLADVPGHCPRLDGDDRHPLALMPWIEAFEESRRWTRGWTLQELIAPRHVVFFGEDWNSVGTLASMLDRVSSITGIQRNVLAHERPISDISVARRLSWTARRETTRKEDEAYCLLGILDLHMPLLYGEGARAFSRLQEELIKVSTDQSLFAWDAPSDVVASRELLLAPSPKCFQNCGNIRRRRGIATESAFRINNKGLEITLPTMRRRLDSTSPHVTLGMLDCRYEGSNEVLALVLGQHPVSGFGASTGLDVYVAGYERQTVRGLQYSRLIAIEPPSPSEAPATLLTITRDLQSQMYKHALDTNASTWFPVRFAGGEIDALPELRDVYPEEFWHASTVTMRLHETQAPVGGVLVELKDGRFVLITFSLYRSTEEPSQWARRLVAAALVDPLCWISHHTASLVRHHCYGGQDSLILQLSERTQLVAQMWHNALTICVERVTETNYLTCPTLFTSPPASPSLTTRASMLSQSPRRDSFFAERIGLAQHASRSRPGSVSGSSRRESFLTNAPTERSGFALATSDTILHRTMQCPRCRDVRAQEEAEERRKKHEAARKAREEEAARLKAARQRKLRRNIKGAATGISVGGLAADFLEIAEFL